MNQIDKTEIAASLIEDFNKAIETARFAKLQPYLVTFIESAEPMKVNHDGRIGLMGLTIYSTSDITEARRIVDGLNRQYRAKGIAPQVKVEPLIHWRARRVAKLEEFIAIVLEGAAA